MEPRLCLGSQHAAFSRNFDVTHMWGKGLREREEAAGEGAAQPVARWPPNRWLGPGSLNTRCGGQSCAPAALLRSLIPVILHPEDSPSLHTYLYLFFYFEIEIHPLLQKKLVSLVCGPVLLVPEIRPSISIAGGEVRQGLLHSGRRICTFLFHENRVLCLLSHAGFFTRDQFVPVSHHTLNIR